MEKESREDKSNYVYGAPEKGENSKALVVDNEKTSLRRSLNLVNVVALMLSATGHVAVFITPGIIVRLSGSLTSTLVLWCLGSLAVYTMALCFTEMATIYQRAGGPYLYVRQTFGRIPGFLTAWGYITLISGPFLAFLSQTAGLYILTAIVGDADCESAWFEACETILAAWILVTMAYLNCVFFRSVVKVQNLLTLSRLISIGIIILSGVYILCTRSVDTFDNPTEGSHWEPGSLSLGFVFVIFSLGGWQALYPLTEEIHSPAKTMPQAIHISFAIQVSLCLLTYASYLAVLDKAEVVGSSAIALLFCKHVWKPLVPVISLLVSLACIGALNTGLMGHSRVLFAAARLGDMPSLLNTLDPQHKTPIIAVLTLTVYGLVLIFTGGAEAMMQFIGLFSLIMSLSVISGLLYLRFTQPEIKRPYRVPTVFAYVQVFLGILVLVLIVYQSPRVMSLGIAIYLAGLPLYVCCVTWTNRPKFLSAMSGRVTRFLQKFFQQVSG